MQIFTLPVGALMTNCYVLATKGGKCIIIDPGGEAQTILQLITNKHLSVATILLTHGHYDHIGAVNELHAITKAKVYMSNKDNIFKSGNFWQNYLGVSWNDLIVTNNLINKDIIRSIEDISLEVIETPGHSKGSVSFYTDGYLFSGDTLFRRGIGRTDLFKGSYSDIICSIKTKLFKLPDETKVYPGHGNTTKIGQEKQFFGFV